MEWEKKKKELDDAIQKASEEVRELYYVRYSEIGRQAQQKLLDLRYNEKHFEGLKSAVRRLQEKRDWGIQPTKVLYQ
jgi:hypothetical protein